MAKVSFASMKLKVNDSVKTIVINEKEVEVKQYLPAEDKNNLLEIAVQSATQGTLLNGFLLDIYFHLYIVMEYTNINFTDNQKSDLLKLYDILESAGVVEEVLKAIPEAEYNILRDAIINLSQEAAKYMISAKAIADNLMQYAPEKSAEIAENVKNFDAEKYQMIVDIAKNANIQ